MTSGPFCAARPTASGTPSCSPTTTIRPGTALQDGAGQPNRIRCVRDERWKYAVYLDPNRRAAPEYEMYDLLEDPNEVSNLLDRATGRPGSPQHELERRRLAARLAQLCAESGTLTPTLPGLSAAN